MINPQNGLYSAHDFSEHNERVRALWEAHKKGCARRVPVTGIFNGAGLWTDGPFTVACNLRGAEAFCLDLIEESEYAHRLLRFITDAERGIEAETKRILDEVRPLTRKFAIRDANDVAPGTPLENIRAFVDAARAYGVYE